MGFSLVVSENGALAAAHGLPPAAAALVAGHGLPGVWALTVAGQGLSGCGSRGSRTRLNGCGTWA